MGCVKPFESGPVIKGVLGVLPAPVCSPTCGGAGGRPRLTDLHGRDPHGEARPGLLLPLVDEFEQPGDGARDDPQSLQGVVPTNHSVGFT